MSDSGDRMFCHACGGVWLRDGHGLTCPHCESDFTEIIEIPPDTTPDTDIHDDPPISTPPSQSQRPRRSQPHPGNPWASLNPWSDDEPQEHGFHGAPGNGFRSQTYRSPDGRFTFSSTTFGGGGGGGRVGGGGGFPGRPSPQRGVADDPLMPMVRSLDTIFHGLADTYRHQGRGGSQGEDPDPWGSFSTHEGHDQHGDDLYAPTRRLFPRDANGPQPMAQPFGTLGDILELFRADFGTQGAEGGGAAAAGGGPGGGGVRVMTGPNPLAMLSTLLNFDRHGDAVYSQEELDRVISQLIDQNMNGTAPPPATQDAIRSLPRKNIDQDMLGGEGKAECSICMEPVQLGTEVTELPCKHWFHYNCIEAWLNQHNTCPHCRRGINSDQPEGTRENPVNVDASGGSASPRRNRHGSTPDFSGSPWPGQPGPPPESGHERRRSSGNNNHGGGGFASWVRSRLGGT